MSYQKITLVFFIHPQAIMTFNPALTTLWYNQRIIRKERLAEFLICDKIRWVRTVALAKPHSASQRSR